MAIVNTLKIYESLKAQMSERSAKVVAEVLEQSFEEYRVNQKEFLATKEDLAGVRSELIKWMFIFWVGQIGATVTFLLALR